MSPELSSYVQMSQRGEWLSKVVKLNLDENETFLGVRSFENPDIAISYLSVILFC